MVLEGGEWGLAKIAAEQVLSTKNINRLLFLKTQTTPAHEPYV